MAPKTRPKRRSTTLSALVEPEHDEKLMSENEEDEQDEDYVPESGTDSDEEEEDSEDEEEEEEEDDDEEEKSDAEEEEEVKMKSRVFDLDGKGTTVCAFGLVMKAGDLIQTTAGLPCVFSKLGEKPNMADVHWLFPGKLLGKLCEPLNTQGAETTSIPLVLLQSHKSAQPIHVNQIATGVKDLSHESASKLIEQTLVSVEKVSLTLNNSILAEWTSEKQKELELFFRTVWPKLKNMYKPYDTSFYGQIYTNTCLKNNADAKSWILWKFNQWENAVLQMVKTDWESEVNQLVSVLS